MDRLNFDDKGYLVPYTIIESSWEIVEEQLVFNTVRANIYVEFKKLCNEIRAIELDDFSVWIDGSFASLKTSPNDMDLVCFIDHKFYVANEIVLKKLRRSYSSLDIYFVKVYPETHANHFLTNFDSLDWLHFFTRDRQNNKKGILKFKICYETLRPTSK